MTEQEEAIARIEQALKEMPDASFRELLAAGLITKRDIVVAYDTPVNWNK